MLVYSKQRQTDKKMHGNYYLQKREKRLVFRHFFEIKKKFVVFRCFKKVAFCLGVVFIGIFSANLSRAEYNKSSLLPLESHNGKFQLAKFSLIFFQLFNIPIVLNYCLTLKKGTLFSPFTLNSRSLHQQTCRHTKITAGTPRFYNFLLLFKKKRNKKQKKSKKRWPFFISK